MKGETLTETVDRRQLLGGGALALAGLSAGSLIGTPGLAAASTGIRDSAVSPAGLAAVSFGWEVTNLHNNGADVSFQVLRDMVLVSTDLDVATMLTALPAAPGFQEVLCQAAVFRHAPPTYGPVPQVYLQPPATTDFGKASFYNPNNLTIGGDSPPYQDKFVSIILKAWVPSDGTASSASRHIYTEPGLALRAGDYVAFHMDHAGVEVDGEMQVVMGYVLGTAA